MSGRISAEDLALHLGPLPAGGRGAWLHHRLRDLIAAPSGGLPATGDRLPSSRELAAQLGLARGTVVGVLDALVGEGLLVSRPRSGLRVAPGAAPGAPAPGHHPAAVRPAGRAGAPSGQLPVPASVGTPDPALFPRATWAGAVRAALRDLADADLGYPDPAGWAPLRQALAVHLARSRGVPPDADRVVVVAGVTQAVQLLATVLGRGPGNAVAVEDPCSPGPFVLLRTAGVEAVPVRVDADGLVVRELPADAAGVLVTPAHQFPTGAVLAASRRQELVEWAAGTGGVVLEDDYDAELRYDRTPVAAVAARAPRQVALLGSLSKTLSPALRLGWVMAPPALVDAVVEAKLYADGGTPVIEQVALASLLRSGAYARHVRRVRVEYGRRRRRFARALTALRPDLADRLETGGIDAGLHVVLPVADPALEAAVVGALRAAGQPAQELSVMSPRDPRPGVVLGTATASPQLAELLAALLP